MVWSDMNVTVRSGGDHFPHVQLILQRHSYLTNIYRVCLSDDDQAASLQDLLEGCLQLLLSRYLPCYFLPSILLPSFGHEAEVVRILQ